MKDDKKCRLEAVYTYLKSTGAIHTKKDFSSIIGANYTNVTSALGGNELYLTSGLFEKIATTFPIINHGWLLTGEGEMLNTPKNPFSQMTEREIGEVSATVRAEEWIKRYEAGEIFPAEIHHQIVAEKDKQIAELQRRIWDLEQQIKKQAQ